MAKSTASRPFGSRTAPVLGLNVWHRPHARRWARSVSLVTVFSFLLPYVAAAFETQPSRSSQPQSSSVQTLQAGGAPVEVPVERGRVLNSYQSRSGATVVFIHDLHCNYEVQNNIAQILKVLHQHNGLNLVGVEGESRAVNVSAARFPVEPVRDRVGEYFLKRGRITGPEFLAGTTLPDLDLEGVESSALYEHNKQVLFQFLNDESQAYCEDLKNVLERLKAPLYTVELAKLDHLRQQYDAEAVTLETYCTQLLGEASRLDLSVLSFPVLNLYASEHRLPQQEDADYDRLLVDAEGLDRAIRERLYTSPDQRQLDQYLRLVGIIERLINISATADDLEYYRAHREAFSVTDIVKYLDNVCYRNAMDLDLEAGVVKLDERVKQAATFYALADRRSEAFVQNLLRLMEQRRTKIAALITGGYHSRLVEESLRRHGVSYLTVKPRITRPDAANPYFSILRNERTTVESLLAKNANLFAPASGFNDAVFRLHYAAVLGVELLRYLAVEKNLTGDALQAEWTKNWQNYEVHRDEIEVDFTSFHANARRDVFVFALRGTDFLVVLRPTRVEQSTAYKVVAAEDLGNGFQFQILPRQAGTAEAQAQLEQILGEGVQAATRVGLEDVQAPLARALQPAGAAVAVAGAFNSLMVAIGVRPNLVPGANLNPALLQPTWPQRLRRLGAAGAWAALRTRVAQGSPAVLTLVTVGLGILVLAPLVVTLPVTAPFLVQIVLIGGLLLSAYFLLQHPRVPSGVRIAVGTSVALLVYFSTFQFIPGVHQTLAAWVPALSSTMQTADTSPRSLLAMASSIPFVGMMFMGMMLTPGGRAVTPEEDRIAKALAWVRAQGYGLSEHEADALRGVLETIDAEAQAEPASPVGKMAETVDGLALLAIARYTGTAAMAVAQKIGEDNMTALANDWAEGEALAAEVLRGRVPADIQGRSFLAQALRARRGATLVFGQSETELLHPERLLAEVVSPLQAKALAKLVKERDLKLTIRGPQFNPILGFHPSGPQAVAAHERLIDLARRLRARVEVRTALTSMEQADLATYAQRGDRPVVVTFGTTLASPRTGPAGTAALVDMLELAGATRYLLTGTQHFLNNARPVLDLLLRRTGPEETARLRAARQEAARVVALFEDRLALAAETLRAIEQVPEDQRRTAFDDTLLKLASLFGELSIGMEDVFRAVDQAYDEAARAGSPRVQLLWENLREHGATLKMISEQLQALGTFVPTQGQSVQLRALDWKAFFADVVAKVDPKAGVQLVFPDPASLPNGTFSADPAQLQRTLTFLIAAAVREGADLVQVRFEQVGERLRIEVEDNGRAQQRKIDMLLPLYTIPGRVNIAEYTYANRFAAANGGELNLSNAEERGMSAVVSLPFTAAPTGGALRGAEGQAILQRILTQGLALLSPGKAVGELSTFLGTQLVAALQAYFAARGVEAATIEQREAARGTAARPMNEVRERLAARLRTALDQAGEEERAVAAQRLEDLVDPTDPERMPILVLSPNADLVGHPTDLDLERLGIFNLNGTIYLTDALYRRWVANALTDEDFDAILLHESLEILGFSHDRAVDLVTAVTGLDHERLVKAAGLTELGPLTVRVPELPAAAAPQMAAAAELSRPVDTADVGPRLTEAQVKALKSDLVREIREGYLPTGSQRERLKVLEDFVGRQAAQVRVDTTQGLTVGMDALIKRAPMPFWEYQKEMSRAVIRKFRSHSWKSAMVHIFLLFFQMMVPVANPTFDAQGRFQRITLSLSMQAYATALIPLITLGLLWTPWVSGFIVAWAVLMRIFLHSTGHEVSHVYQYVVMERLRQLSGSDLTSMEFKYLLENELEKTVRLLGNDAPSPERLIEIATRLVDDYAAKLSVPGGPGQGIRTGTGVRVQGPAEVGAGSAQFFRTAVPLRLTDRLNAFGQTLWQVLRVRPSTGVPAFRIGIQGGLISGLQAFFAPAWTTALAFLGAFFSEGLAGAVLLNPEVSVDSVRRWLPVLGRLPATTDTVGIRLTFEDTQALVQVPRALAPRIGRTLRTIGISVLDELNQPNNRFRLGFGGAA